MVFSSIFFIFTFLPLTLLLYYAVPFRHKNLALLLCSLVFYAWGEPVYVVLMILNIAFNYVMGLDIGLKKQQRQLMRARISLVITIVINLGLLGFFKYFGFLMTNINHLFHLNIPFKELGLPIGISFYTFQILSYIIDVYREEIRPQKSIIILGTYVTMFPQLVAGPIVQYSDVEAQLQKRDISLEKFGQGVKVFIVGLSKKVLLANTVGAVFDTLSAMDHTGMSVLTGWLIAASFTFQIYFDFSGYSDMAIGLGKMLGFEFRQNFNYPYISTSAEEFWRRWHISLSTWFRDYLYIPLGGSYVPRKLHIRNILVVWILTGLWHGAAWNFLLWGLYYGLILLFEKFFLLPRTRGRTPEWIMHIYTILVFMIGWVIFSSADLPTIGHVLSVMFGIFRHPLVDSTGLYYLTTNLLPGVIMVAGSTPFMKKMVRFSQKQWPKASQVMILVGGMVLFILCIAYLVNETYNPFLYFRF